MSAVRYAQVVPEGGGLVVFIPGLPVAADGLTVEEAIREWLAVPSRHGTDGT